MRSMDGDGRMNYEAKYAEDGRTLSYVYVAYDGDEETIYSQEYLYDDHGNLTMERTLNGEEVVSEAAIEYVYDDNDKVIEKWYNDGIGSVTHTIYGDNTETIEVYDENEVLVYQSEAVYVKEGLLKEYYVVDENTSFTESYTYDEEDNILTYEYCDLLSGHIKTEKYEYDAAAGTKVITRYIYEDGEETGIYTQTYRYADNDELIYYEEVDQYGQVTYSREVEFDDYGIIIYQREIGWGSDTETFISYECDYLD